MASKGQQAKEVLIGEALDLVVSMLADLVEAASVDADDFVDDLDRLSQIAGILR